MSNISYYFLGSQQGNENSRMYNEMVIIKMVQATSKLLQIPPEIFQNEILEHFHVNGMNMYQRIKGWMELSKTMQQSKSEHSEITSITAGINYKSYNFNIF